MTTVPPPPRGPRVFSSDDPALAASPSLPELQEADPQAAELDEDATPHSPASSKPPSRMSRLLSWGSVLVGTLVSLFVMATVLWFTRYLSVALDRQDVIGQIAFGLLCLAGLAVVVILGREVLGLLRLGRLHRVRQGLETALQTADPQSERTAVAEVKALFKSRPELRWGLAELAEHERDVRDPGDLTRLAERALMTPLDTEARRLVVGSAKRVSMVTALSPSAFLSVLYVLIENVGLLRRLATVYGGRPGTLGALKLGRMVFTHLIATGGVALTDDLFGQFLGQDMLRRVSSRLGEGAFNAALTARVGTAAIHVCRPIPFRDMPPVRLRDMLSGFLPDLFPKKLKDPVPKV